jgi:predicted nucleic acid-binding protein
MYVPDTGPLWTFAVVGRLDLLEARLRGSVEWTTAVFDEVTRNAAREPRLGSVLSATWLPPPVDLATLDPDLARDALRIRATFAAPGDHPRQHLGEAEAIVYAQHIGGATLVTQDGAAMRRAHFEQLHCLSVTGLMQELVAFGELSADDAWAVYVGMVNEGRLPPGLDRAEIVG